MKHTLRFVSRRHTRPKSGRAKLPKRLAAVVTGSMSTFGGPGDSGVSASEGLAIMVKADLTNPAHAHLFELEQPVGTSGLARRLDAKQHFIAMRWAYTERDKGRMTPFGRNNDFVTSREWLRTHTITVTANGRTFTQVRATDYGPNQRTGRVADISPGLARDLKLKTDDAVTVIIHV